jgi:hypothetical protein
LRRVKRTALDREFLRLIDAFPGEVARLGECAHGCRLSGKGTNPEPEAALEEFRVGAVGHRLELPHVDMVLADEWPDLARAEARVLIGGK